MKNILVVISALLTLAFSTKAKAEDSLRVFKRSSIYLEIGGGEYVRTNLNVGHYFVNANGFHLGAQASYGPYTAWSNTGREMTFMLSTLAGKKIHFFELRAGALLLKQTSGKYDVDLEEKSRTEVVPAIFVGYTLRWKHLLFKVNVNPSPRYATFNAGTGILF